MFKYGRPVTGEYFVNRENEINEIEKSIKGIKNGAEINIALVGLRRVGKTSILKNLKFEDRELIPVMIDCYGIPSKKILANLIINKTIESYISKTGDKGYKIKLLNLLKQKTSKIFSKLENLELSFSKFISIRIGMKEKIEEDILLHDALIYLEILGEEKGVYFVLILDEFPDIAIRWKKDWVKRLRSVIQEQKRVAYIFSGSAISYMNELVYKRDSPFYRQLKVIFVRELPRKVCKSFIEKRLDVDEKAMEKYLKLTGCLPDYVQRLGHVLSEKSGKIDISRMIKGYEEMLDELDPEFEDVLARVSEKSNVYGEIIISLSKYKKPSEISKSIGLALTSLPKYMIYLRNIGIVKKSDGYELTDPIFGDWLRRRYYI